MEERCRGLWGRGCGTPMWHRHLFNQSLLHLNEHKSGAASSTVLELVWSCRGVFRHGGRAVGWCFWSWTQGSVERLGITVPVRPNVHCSSENTESLWVCWGLRCTIYNISMTSYVVWLPVRASMTQSSPLLLTLPVYNTPGSVHTCTYVCMSIRVWETLCCWGPIPT